VIVGGAKGGVIVLLSAGLFSIVFVASSNSLRELIWKLSAGLLVLIVLLLPGPFVYVRGLYGYSATMLLLPTIHMFGISDLPAIFATAFPNDGSLLEVAKIWASDIR
jgi:hypothetical protein